MKSGPLRAAEAAALKTHLDAVERRCELTSGPEIEATTKAATKSNRIAAQTTALEAQALDKLTGRLWWQAKRAREAAER
jgi:hypothetical protein